MIWVTEDRKAIPTSLFDVGLAEKFGPGDRTAKNGPGFGQLYRSRRNG